MQYVTTTMKPFNNIACRPILCEGAGIWSFKWITSVISEPPFKHIQATCLNDEAEGDNSVGHAISPLSEPHLPTCVSRWHFIYAALVAWNLFPDTFFVHTKRFGRQITSINTNRQTNQMNNHMKVVTACIVFTDINNIAVDFFSKFPKL